MDFASKLLRCREMDFLAPLGDADLESFVGGTRELELASGEILFAEGDTAESMFLVLEGRLAVIKQGNEIAHATAGTYIGEMALVESKVRSASAKATEGTLLLEVSDEQFQTFITPNPAALLAITKTLSVRSRNDLAVLDSSLRQLRAYSSEVEQTNQELREIRQELMRSNRELERISALDQLTGLANRRRFDVALSYEWRRSLRTGKPLSLIICDIDCFKNYNDAYGHPAGDDALVRVADILHTTVRRAADVVARYGGEEFAVILADTDAEGARKVGENLRRGIDQGHIPHASSSVTSWLTISVGVATLAPERQLDPSALIDRADRALYAAKQAGRNRVFSDGQVRE